MTEETTPQYARRLGKEYAERFHDQWSHADRNWIRMAFARGYERACIDQAAEAEKIGRVVDGWDDEAVTDADLLSVLDAWLERIFERAPEEKVEAA